MTNTAQTVFVVDDDTSFLASITRWLRANGYAAQGYSCATDFLARRPTDAPGCVVLDLRMPGVDGMQLHDTLAHSDHPLPVVFLTGHGDIPTSVRAMRAGAEDFLVKTTPGTALLAAIDRALARDARERKARLARHDLDVRFEKLTPRENEVLAHVLRGQLNKQIAWDLGIDERSVKRHRTNLMRKLEVNSVAELARLAVAVGVIDAGTASDNE